MAHSPVQALSSAVRHPGIHVKPFDGTAIGARYEPGKLNHCPDCASTQWYVGRLSAQCAVCETALPLAQACYPTSPPVFVTRFAKRANKA
ncbi:MULTISPECIES: hypothetical protein [Sphingobium]|uniref:hypothetical protein n=1 Tax=Sphingobium TaxID=165695 RepID=UPI0015EC4BBC|nr:MULTISPECIES: hypothetical protein [Sphingobium]MCW2363326.1 hypothetical protein [Sphingobium sp. B10D3B]MCW2403275.1 hypothetical protein [Sphingobium sp. B10D7B]MCW2406972.1 hypothetical protein [Sphingobium xanthum]